MTRINDIPVSWDERAILTTMLEYTRDTVRAKCLDLTEENARRAPLPESRPRDEHRARRADR
jgi:hypothetical protein